MSALSIVVDGQWMTALAPWTSLRFSHNANGGCAQASFDYLRGPAFSHPALRRGATVTIYGGAHPVWTGYLSAAPAYDDDTGWSVDCDGLAAKAGRGSQYAGYLCLDSSGNTTSIPDTAIDRAIDDGIGWTRPDSISAASFAPDDDTIKLNRLGDLLDAWTKANSLRWGVDAFGRVYTRADPTTPTLHMTPGSGSVGLADDDYATHVYLRYKVAGGTYATATASDTDAATAYGRAEVPVDATPRGVMTSTEAATSAQGVLDAGAARLAWTAPVSPTRYQLLSTGGVPVSGWAVRPQTCVRLHGVTDPTGKPRAYADFVVGQTQWDDDTATLTLTPTEAAPSTMSDVIAALGKAAS